MSEDKEGYIWFAPDFRINNEKRETANWPLADSPVISLRDGVLKVSQWSVNLVFRKSNRTFNSNFGIKKIVFRAALK